MKKLSRQAMHYTRYPQPGTHINGDTESPVVLVRGKSYGCTFIITDDNQVHLYLHEDGMESVRKYGHEWLEQLTDPLDPHLYSSYGSKKGFTWKVVPYVNTSNLESVVLKCKQIACLNIKSKPFKERTYDR